MRKDNRAFTIRTVFVSVSRHGDPDSRGAVCRCEPEVGPSFCRGNCHIDIRSAETPEGAADLTPPVFVRAVAIASDGREFVRIGGFATTAEPRRLKRLAETLRRKVATEALKRPTEHPSQEWVREALRPGNAFPKGYSPPHRRPLYPSQ